MKVTNIILQIQHPPKYEYGYKIPNEKGAQGKIEARDGIYALGRYVFINNYIQLFYLVV